MGTETCLNLRDLCHLYNSGIKANIVLIYRLPQYGYFRVPKPTQNGLTGQSGAREKLIVNGCLRPADLN